MKTTIAIVLASFCVVSAASADDSCAVQAIEFLVQRGAQRVLLVTDQFVRPNIELLVEALQQAGCTVVESRFVNAEPTLAFFNSLLQDARTAQIDSVLGVGGGSVIDVAKLLAALTRSEQTAAQVFGINLLQAR